MGTEAEFIVECQQGLHEDLRDELPEEYFNGNDSDDDDLGKTFKSMRVWSQNKKKANQEWSTNYLKELGIKFVSKNNGLHLIVGEWHFWPSTGKFINHKKQVKGRGVKNFVKRLRHGV